LRNNSKDSPLAIGFFFFDEAVKLRRGSRTWQKIKYRLQKLWSAKNATNDNEPVYAVFPGFTFSQGWAGYLVLIQELGLPYVPIAVHKPSYHPKEHIEQLPRLIGAEAAQE